MQETPKADFYKKYFNLTDEEFTKMINTHPELLGYSEASVRQKASFYKKEFNLTSEEFIKMQKRLPALLSYSKESVKQKASFYKQVFNLANEEFKKMLMGLPMLLCYSEESVRQKVIFYKKEFNLTDEEFIKMLKLLPTLLGLSEESIRQKKEQILNINISKKYLINSPSILTVPTNTLKIRYLILRQVAPKERLLKRMNAFITNQDKLYARLAYFKNEKTEDIYLSNLLAYEKLFQQKFGVTTQELIQKYPITEKVLKNLLETLYDQEKLEFSPSEKQFIEEEYEV